MSTTNTVSRSLHDVSLAAWFGGTLMGAVGVNKAGAAVATDAETTRVASASWDAWTPVNLAAIGTHLVSNVPLVVANRGRLFGQRGVAAVSAVKTALTLAALGTTAYSRMLGKRVSRNSDSPSEDGTTPTTGTAPEVAAAQRQLDVLQWVIPALVGGIIVANARQGELQRPVAVTQGILRRLAG
jgi:hypothetical protein